MCARAEVDKLWGSLRQLDFSQSRRVIAYGEPIFEAIANPRLHHQLEPAILYAEDWTTGGVAFNYSSQMLQVGGRQ